MGFLTNNNTSEYWYDLQYRMYVCTFAKKLVKLLLNDISNS